jgi:hypothetical protein
MTAIFFLLFYPRPVRFPVPLSLSVRARRWPRGRFFSFFAKDYVLQLQRLAGSAETSGATALEAPWIIPTVLSPTIGEILVTGLVSILYKVVRFFNTGVDNNNS